MNSVKEFQKRGVKNIGIYTSAYEWALLTGFIMNCGEVAEMGLPLWYSSLNNKPNMDDYSRIGGWTNAYRK